MEALLDLKSTNRRTRIVATVGPASESPEMIGRLIDAGVNVFRLNFSHGSHELHGRAARNIRSAAAERARPIAILQDLQGAKIRTGELVNHEPVELVSGSRVRITTEPLLGRSDVISTTYAALPRDVRPGDPVLLDDGRMELEVTGCSEKEVTAKVMVGGMLGEHKGINLPRTPLSAPCLTEKDRDDLRFGLEQGVDFVGLSFVRKASDIEQVRREAEAVGRKVFVIAKIERVEAIANLEEIVKAADGVMVARGDLGVETSTAEVPLLQKRILSVAGRHAKPDITATQMLEAMVSNPRPTRAEAADVANAVFDGTDALMLSAETALGKYPVEAVRTMGQIAAMAEQHLSEYGRTVGREGGQEAAGVADAVVDAACLAARRVGGRAIGVFTLSGRTAHLVAARRPDVPIVAFTPNEDAYRRLALAWGVRPILSEFIESPEELVNTLDRHLTESGLVRKGEAVVMLTGATNMPGATNIMRIHRVGDVPPGPHGKP